MNGQLRASTALLPAKKPPVPVKEAAEWAPEPVGMFWRQRDVLPVPESNDSSVVQPTV
jgi:hypothetical protein